MCCYFNNVEEVIYILSVTNMLEAWLTLVLRHSYMWLGQCTVVCAAEMGVAVLMTVNQCQFEVFLIVVQGLPQSLGCYCSLFLLIEASLSYCLIQFTEVDLLPLLVSFLGTLFLDIKVGLIMCI